MSENLSSKKNLKDRSVSWVPILLWDGRRGVYSVPPTSPAADTQWGGLASYYLADLHPGPHKLGIECRSTSSTEITDWANRPCVHRWYVTPLVFFVFVLATIANFCTERSAVVVHSLWSGTLSVSFSPGLLSDSTIRTAHNRNTAQAFGVVYVNVNVDCTLTTFRYTKRR